MRLKDKVAIVMGAGQSPGERIGNGRAAAMLYAREGAKVVAVDRDIASAEETAAMITEKAIKIAGGSGLMRGFPLQRFHRDARAGLIMPPNTEKCLELAGKNLAEGKAGALMT